MTLDVLRNFAYIHDIDQKLEELASIAQPENWSYRHTPSPHKLPILFNYLFYTFARLHEEGKVACSTDGTRACFNTGLVTPNQEEVFAYLVPNKNPDQQAWFLAKFCRESDRDLLVFGQLPDTAHYFSDPSELLYNTTLDLRKNVDHIIDDNKGRFPEPFRSMVDNYQLRIALDGSIEHAKKRVTRNYKTAVPQYYQGRIQLLLPLCMTNRSNADLALVVYRQGDVYLASTCLTLDMAYNNARLLARPDTEWLEP